MRIHALAMALALVACKQDDPTTTPDGSIFGPPDTGTEVAPWGFTVEPGSITGVMVATLTTDEEATVSLRYGRTGQELSTQHPETSTGTEHSFTVLGVKTGKVYDFEVDVDGETAVVSARVTPSDPSMPLYEVDEWDASLACQDGGFILMSYLGNDNSGIAILDRDGDMVWALPFPRTNVQVTRVRPALDGRSLLYTTTDGDRVQQIGEHIRQPLDGSAPDVLSTPRSHHDFVELPDGTIGWLDYAAFGPYDNCTPGTGPLTQDAALDRIVESPFGGPEVGVYDMWTDYPRTMNCDVDDEEFLKPQGVFDLSHSNSIAYRASDDAYFHMSRWQDAFYKVDRATGAFVWEFGGPHNDFTPAKGQDPSELFNHSHMSEIWDDGLLVFNNNDHGPNGEGPSIAQEYVLDETAMTWDLTWQWTSEHGFEKLLGDVRRMPQSECDNVLISLANTGMVREITRDGQVAWNASSAFAKVTSRVYFVPDIYDLTTAFHE